MSYKDIVVGDKLLVSFRGGFSYAKTVTVTKITDHQIHTDYASLIYWRINGKHCSGTFGHIIKVNDKKPEYVIKTKEEYNKLFNGTFKFDPNICPNDSEGIHSFKYTREMIPLYCRKCKMQFSVIEEWNKNEHTNRNTP